MCWLRGWSFSRLHLQDELVRIYLPFHSLTALLSLMAEVGTITRAIREVLRLMILCVNYFSPLRTLRDKKMKELLCLRWDLQGPVSSGEEWRWFPGLRVWSSCCWQSLKGWALGTSQGHGLRAHGKEHAAKGTSGLKVLENIWVLQMKRPEILLTS